MIVKTEAIVISSIKYGDTSRILKCYTRSSGIKSFIAKGVYSKRNKTNPMFLQLNQLEMIYEDRISHKLINLNNCRQLHHFLSIQGNREKTAITLFLSEILNMVLKEEEHNPQLFDFISSSFQLFDSKGSAYSDFHLWFLLNLTTYLGFYPNLKQDSGYFDLLNGVSTIELPSGIYITGEKLKLFNQLRQLCFSNQTENCFNQNQRKELIDLILRYYELHHPDFKWPKSLEVLQTIFD